MGIEPYKNAHRLIESHTDILYQDWGENDIDPKHLFELRDRRLFILNTVAKITSYRILINMKKEIL